MDYANALKQLRAEMNVSQQNSLNYYRFHLYL